jgi:hypothetical protein
MEACRDSESFPMTIGYQKAIRYGMDTRRLTGSGRISDSFLNPS